MEFKLIIKKTNELSSRETDSIIELKQQHWPYDYEKQKKWLKDNIYDDDLHFYICQNDKFLAYLNIVNVDAIMDNTIYCALGIGNVCVDNDFRHNGIGSILIQSANLYIKSLNRIGILLCKSNLVDFYKNLKWNLIDCNNTIINNEIYDNSIMLFGFPKSHFEEIKICRNF